MKIILIIEHNITELECHNIFPSQDDLKNSAELKKYFHVREAISDQPSAATMDSMAVCCFSILSSSLICTMVLSRFSRSWLTLK